MSQTPDMDKLLNDFLRTCFPSNYGEHSLGMDVRALRELRGRYLKKAKAAILKGLKKKPEKNPLLAALELQMVESIPIIKRWFNEVKSDRVQGKSAKGDFGVLVYVLYELTKDPAYIADMVEVVRTASYSDFDNSVSQLERLPLTPEGIEAVWQRYKRRSTVKNLESWRDECISFLKEKITEPVGKIFLESIPEEEKQELLALISEDRREISKRNIDFLRYVDGTERYGKESLNEAREYIKIGGSPINGMTLTNLWRGHTDRINSLAWSENGELLTSTSSDESIMVWNFKDHNCQDIFLREKNNPSTTTYPISIFWTGMEKMIANYLIIGSEDLRSVEVWDLSTKTTESLSAEVDDNQLYIVTIFHDGKRYLLSDRRNPKPSYSVLDMSTGKKEPFLSEFSGIIGSIVLSPNGKMLSFARRDNFGTNNEESEIILYDLSTRNVSQKLVGHNLYINQLLWAKKRPLLFSASHDNTIGVWDIETFQKVASLEEHVGVVNGIALSADERLLASKSNEDRTIIIWDTTTWKALMVLRERNENGNAFAWHPSLPILVTTANEIPKNNTAKIHNMIRVWEFDVEEFTNNPSFIESFDQLNSSS